MANPVHLWLRTEGGNTYIEGSSTVSKREGSIEVLALDHTVEIPTDAHTGKLTGTRIHTPFRFTKEIDVSTPYLYKAVSKGETIDRAEFDWYQIENGNEVVYFKTLLEKVKVVKVESKLHDTKDPAKAHYKHMEEVELRYEKITWEIVDGAHKHADEWNER